MKTIGILGGMSWQSTATYYKLINELTNQTLGGLSSAKIIINSVDFNEIAIYQHNNNWENISTILIKASKAIEAAGADFLIIATNTIHKIAAKIQSNLNIPLLHIVDNTAQEIIKQGFQRVGLLGTIFTMEQDFYKTHLKQAYNIDVLIPDTHDRILIHNIIFEELCQGIITNKSRDIYLNIINKLTENGSEAIILGCTEIALLIQSCHTHIPLLDTTTLHANSAVAYALATH